VRAPESHILIHFVMNAGAGFALGKDECLSILQDAGFRFRGPVCQLNLLDVPSSMGATELEQYLREHAAEITGERI